RTVCPYPSLFRSIHGHGTTVRLQQPHDVLDRHGFSGTGRSDDHHRLAVLDVQREPLEHPLGAEGLVNVSKVDGHETEAVANAAIRPVGVVIPERSPGEPTVEPHDGRMRLGRRAPCQRMPPEMKIAILAGATARRFAAGARLCGEGAECAPHVAFAKALERTIAKLSHALTRDA